MLCEAQHTLFGAIRIMLTLMGPWMLNINKRTLVLTRLCPFDGAHLHSQRSSSNKTLWPFQTSQLNDSVWNRLLFWAGLLLFFFFFFPSCGTYQRLTAPVFTPPQSLHPLAYLFLQARAPAPAPSHSSFSKCFLSKPLPAAVFPICFCNFFPF